MGMSSNSNHFRGTNGAKKHLFFKINIQLFASKFSVPKTLKKINAEKQLRHICGSDNKSQLSISLSECNTLVKKYSGKGTMVNTSQEVVNFGKIIGYINTPTGLRPTTWGKIHYSKTGTHIVPYYQQKKGKK